MIICSTRLKKYWLNKADLGFISFLICFSINTIYCQDTIKPILTMQKAVELTVKNSLSLKNYVLLIKKANLDRRSSIDIRPTEFDYKNGQLYGIENSQFIGMNQNFGSVLKHIETAKKNNINKDLAALKLDLEEKQLIAEVKTIYTLWEYAFQIAQINADEKDLYQRLSEVAETKYKTGEIGLLKMSQLKTKSSEINGIYLMSVDEFAIADVKLKQYIDTSGEFIPASTNPEMYIIDRPSELAEYNGNTYIEYQNKIYNLAQKEVDIKKSEYFPELKAGIFSQKIGSTDQLFGWQIGVAIPLWIPKQNGAIQQAKIESEIASTNIEKQKQEIAYKTETLLFELNKYFHQISYFREDALPASEIMLNVAALQLKNEEIEYIEYLESVSEAFRIKRQFCEAIRNYNQTAIELELYAK